VQAREYNQASRLSTQATRLATLAGQQRSVDVGVFTAWVNAAAQHDTALEEFVRARFRQEFRPAFDAWIATHPMRNPDAPSSPFLMSEYRSGASDSAQLLTERSAAIAGKAGAANQQADLYTLTAVVLAAVMFFAGISQQAKHPPTRMALIILAALGCVIGIWHIAVYPIE
jgi:hypothetical protein